MAAAALSPSAVDSGSKPWEDRDAAFEDVLDNKGRESFNTMPYFSSSSSFETNKPHCVSNLQIILRERVWKWRQQ
jgi:hypothetical protein